MAIHTSTGEHVRVEHGWVLPVTWYYTPVYQALAKILTVLGRYMVGPQESRISIGKQFRHYKGGLYTTKAMVSDLVTWRAAVLYVNQAGEEFVRPANEWFDEVEPGQLRFVMETRVVAGILKRQMQIDAPSAGSLGLADLTGAVYLVARRNAASSHPRSWEFPGGKVELGETDEQAIVREWQEEFGLAVKFKYALDPVGPYERNKYWRFVVVPCFIELEPDSEEQLSHLLRRASGPCHDMIALSKLSVWAGWRVVPLMFTPSFFDIIMAVKASEQ